MKLYKILFEDIDIGAFHGFGMKPQEMRVPSCDIEWQDMGDTSQGKGCPSFPGKGAIEDSELTTAIEYLKDEKPKTMIAYSRGGAIMIKALMNGAPKPGTINFVAPAWKRSWATGLSGNVASGNGMIIHGGMDDKVPLKHSVELAMASGLPLYVVPDANHINILKHKMGGGTLVKPEKLESGMNELPDWGAKGAGKPEEVQKQREWCNDL